MPAVESRSEGAWCARTDRLGQVLGEDERDVVGQRVPDVRRQGFDEPVERVLEGAADEHGRGGAQLEERPVPVAALRGAVGVEEEARAAAPRAGRHERLW